jgi:DNA-directed RNA polymerase specialized sigma24 family protein
MPEAEREVIMLRVFEGLSHRSIARRLGRPSVNAVHKLYGRALARLAKLLGRGG